jgi:hypothetical protein
MTDPWVAQITANMQGTQQRDREARARLEAQRDVEVRRIWSTAPEQERAEYDAIYPGNREIAERELAKRHRLAQEGLPSSSPASLGASVAALHRYSRSW